MKLLIAFTFLIYCSAISNLQAQSRMVINDNAYLVIDNAAYLVIDNSNANALAVAGTGGRIKSEAENNRVRWNIGTTTGTYTVPFSDDAAEGGTKIPYTLTIGTAGVGAGYIDFSSYDGPTWDNSTYMPSMVTHMGQLYAPNDVNHSEKAIDRFWVINAQGYTTKPTPSSMVFTYIDNEHSAAGNTLPEANLGAQRFNNGASLWGDMLPIGVVNTAANTVTTPAITVANFFAAWTLSDVTDPLPVTLSSFTATCKEKNIELEWVTQTELNNDYFVLEKSYDGFVFFEVAQIKGNGNSNISINYKINVEAENKTIYFRLKQVDFDGTINYHNIISSNCTNSSFEVTMPLLTENQLSFMINSELDENFQVYLYDYRGRLITDKSESLQKGLNTVRINNLNLSSGIYMLSIVGQNNVYSTKLLRR
ncbi:MAG: T9SS type A sorting domain-containing protein [Flavobacteriales bacterium]|nr:T9SS type A sorting domain-containing protein [Flavobacteriales bacterium]